MEPNDVTIERRQNAHGSFPLLKEMYVEPGCKDDWDLLSGLHYKTEGQIVGPHYWRCVLHGETIGVVVFSTPFPILKERNLLMPMLKPARDTKIVNTWRYYWVNKNVRVISRMVVDTMFRGIGVSYRMQNLACRMEGYRFLEIQSSMSKFNKFAERAGFKFLPPLNSNKHEVGLKFFRARFDAHPADQEAILKELEAMPESARKKTIADMRRFYFANSAREKTGSAAKHGGARVEEMPVDKLIKNLQQLVLASPLYGVYKNPDYEKEVPKRLPLIAFDSQNVTENLRFEENAAD